MKPIDLLPSLLNWPLVIAALITAYGITFFAVSIPILLYETYRIRKIFTEFQGELTTEIIRGYYGKDPAYKWIPVKNQIEGLRKGINSKNND